MTDQPTLRDYRQAKALGESRMIARLQRSNYMRRFALAESEICFHLRRGECPDVPAIFNEYLLGAITPIDKTILPLLIATNQRGFRTTGSCGGHLDRGTQPYSPFVNILCDTETEFARLLGLLSPIMGSVVVMDYDNPEENLTCSFGVFVAFLGGSQQEWTVGFGKFLDAIRRDLNE